MLCVSKENAVQPVCQHLYSMSHSCTYSVSLDLLKAKIYG